MTQLASKMSINNIYI